MATRVETMDVAALALIGAALSGVLAMGHDMRSRGADLRVGIVLAFWAN